MRQPGVSDLKLLAAGLCALWLCLGGPVDPAPAMTVSPANPTISVGQTQQFTSSGANAGLAAVAVSAGGEYTCVTLADGTGQCTGRNQFGQHGNGTFNDSSVLDPVSGLSNAFHVSAGDEFACALLTDGTVKCWGLGESGQRGDGSFSTFALTPVDVIGLAGATALDTGYGQACVLLGDGSMRCWGENREGQLGNGTTATPGTAHPVVVVGITGATAIATGAYHTCALLSDGTVKCWGRNGQGQLGDGTLNSSSSPVQVQTGFGVLSGVTAIAAGGAHTCALLANGTVRCWGDNVEGQLGDGTTFGKPNGIGVTGINSAVALSAGWQHTCAILMDGTARCWGANAFGQVGNGTFTRALTPAPVSGITGATGITAGWWHHSCAVLGDGTVKCWGANDWGQLGSGTALGSAVPVTMAGTGGSGGPVTWASSDTGVATIDANGRATGVGSGVTTITATDSTGDTGSTTLTVVGQRTLSVVRAGAGTGSVSSNPAGISCGTDCSEPYADNTSVTLTAAAAGGSTFAGWAGCDTVSGTTCTVTMTASRTVTATFDVPRFLLTVNKTGLASGNGSVSSTPAGIDCGADCSESYTAGTVVTLTATPSALFSGWTGCDAVSGATCTVTMQSARSVSAAFVGMPF